MAASPDLLGMAGSSVIDAMMGSIGRYVSKPTSDFFAPYVPDVVLLIDPGETGADVTVSAEQAESIRRFLSMPAIKSLVGIAILHKLAYPDMANKYVGVGLGDVYAEFVKAAERWCDIDSASWADHASIVWNNALSVVDQIPQAFLEHAGFPAFESSLEQIFFAGLTRGATPAYFRRIVDISQSPARMSALSDFIEAIRLGQARRIDGSFVVHGADKRIPFESLYVTRSLRDIENAEVVEAVDFLQPNLDWQNSVIIGDPGVGKSTFVSWLEWSSGKLDVKEARLAPVVTVPASIYLSRKGRSLPEQLRTALTAHYGLGVSLDDVEALLAMGSVTLVVDALDEIRDLSWRQELIAQVGSLAKNYPFLRVICTTRRTGDEAAMFKRLGFRVFEIREYDDPQVKEYVRRWFELQGRPNSQALKFLGEARHLRDLLVNPLMLSLLCIVYVRTSYIPQSRWNIYQRCAFLMFLEWETSRDLEVPPIHKESGEAAIRALVHYFRSSGGYSATIAESVARKVITDVLKQGGANTLEATADADTILRHCTERAWVFSVRETTAGEKQFGFTHRTFYEFYLADAIVSEVFGDMLRGRSGADPLNALREAIIREHRQDPSSVLPELIVQAADERADGNAGEQILAGLVHNSETKFEVRMRSVENATNMSETWRARELARLTPNRADYEVCVSNISLAARLLSGARTNLTVGKRVIDRVVELWRIGDSFTEALEEISFSVESMEAFRCLLDVPSGHRDLLIEQIRSRVGVGASFARRYAVIVARNEDDLYDTEWRRAAESIPIQYVDDSPLGLWYSVSRGAMHPWTAMRGRAELSHIALEVEAGRSPRAHGGEHEIVVRAGLLWHWIAQLSEPVRGDERKTVAAHARLVARRYTAMIGQADPLDEHLVTGEMVQLARGGLEYVPASFILTLAIASQSTAAISLAAAAGAETADAYDGLVEIRHTLRTQGPTEDVELAALQARASALLRAAGSTLTAPLAEVVGLRAVD